MIAAEAYIVLLQLNGPERGVDLAVLVLPVSVHTTHRRHESYHHNDNDSKDDNVKLVPRELSHRGCGCVWGRAGQGRQQGRGGELSCNVGTGGHGGEVNRVGSS